jgi:hypothetical protein
LEGKTVCEDTTSEKENAADGDAFGADSLSLVKYFQGRILSEECDRGHSNSRNRGQYSAVLKEDTVRLSSEEGDEMSEEQGEDQ